MLRLRLRLGLRALLRSAGLLLALPLRLLAPRVVGALLLSASPVLALLFLPLPFLSLPSRVHPFAACAGRALRLVGTRLFARRGRPLGFRAVGARRTVALRLSVRPVVRPVGFGARRRRVGGRHELRAAPGGQ